MTVADLDEKGITFVKDGVELTLTWGEVNFLKRYRADAPKSAPASKHSRRKLHRR